MINKNTDRRFIKKISNFRKGLNNFLEKNKIDDDELSVAENIRYIDNGAPQSRGGTKLFGNIQSNVITLLANFISTSATEINIITGGNLKKYNIGTGNFDTIQGLTFEANAVGTSTMLGEKLYISNGIDPLTIYNGTTLTRFTSISAPTGLSATLGTSLSAGSYSYSYRVTATNDVGETESSTAVTVTTNKRREEWNFDPNSPNANFSILLSWTAVTGAKAYNIYGVKQGSETYLDTVTTGTSYRDYGLKESSLLFSAPTGNTTIAPKGNVIATYNSSIFIAGDEEAPSRLYYSAGLDQPENFTIGAGGGYVDIQAGSDDGKITALYPFQNQLIVFKNRSIWSFRFGTEAPQVQNISNLVGCINPRCVTQVENDLFFVFEKNDGIALYSLGYEPNFQNVLRTAEVSIRVKNSINNVRTSNLKNVCVCYADGKLYVSYAEGNSAKNNRVLVYDRERASYSVDTGISARQMILARDNNQNPRLLWIDDADNTVTEYNSNFLDDKGALIKWKYRTKDFDLDLPMDTKKLHWVFLSFLQGEKKVRINIYTDEKVYTTTLQITPQLISTILGIGRLGVARIGVVGVTEVLYNNIVRIPIERLGVNALCKRFSIEVLGESVGSRGALQNAEMIYKIKNSKINTITEIIQI